MTTISMVYSPPPSLPPTNEQQNILNFDIFVTFTTLCEYHPNNVTTMNNLAEIYKRQGEYDEAENLHENCLEEREAMIGDDHPATL